MKNSELNIHIIRRVAHALSDFPEKVFFVGGAVIPLYVHEPGSEDVRPTYDVDITFDISTSAGLESLREKLINKGFIQSHEDNVICRFRFDDIIVDVMSTTNVDWAPSNKWFKAGISDLQTVNLGNGLQIDVLSLPYYLCTKFEAHNDRGINDPRFSKDFEDIVYLFDNISDISEQIQKAPEDVRIFLSTNCRHILEDSLTQEAVYGHLSFALQEERFQLIMKKIKTVSIP